jgi:MSHA pilin protein MshD
MSSVLENVVGRMPPPQPSPARTRKGGSGTGTLFPTCVVSQAPQELCKANELNKANELSNSKADTHSFIPSPVPRGRAGRGRSGLPHSNHGMTLIELVVAITVIGIAITSVLGVLSTISIRSGEAMIREEATNIASAYLNEITLKAYQDPNGPENGRANFDDVGDYNNLPDTTIRDQFGNLVAGLDQFSISVAVGPSGVALGQAPNIVSPANVKTITVTVTHTSGLMVVLSGYKVN